jgi:hypothetical protein
MLSVMYHGVIDIFELPGSSRCFVVVIDWHSNPVLPTSKTSVVCMTVMDVYLRDDICS